MFNFSYSSDTEIRKTVLLLKTLFLLFSPFCRFHVASIDSFVTEVLQYVYEIWREMVYSQFFPVILYIVRNNTVLTL